MTLDPRRAAAARFLALLGVTLLLAACGGQSSAPQRDARELATVRARSGLPTVTPSPTRTPPTPTATLAPTATATPLSDADAALAAGLLTRADLRAAWTDGEPVEPPSFCDQPSLVDAFAPLVEVSDSWNDSSGGYLVEWLVRLPEGTGGAAMEHARAMLACEAFDTRQGDRDILFWKLSESRIATVGDDMVARDVGLTFSNPVYTPMNGAVAVIRSGDTIATVLAMGYDGASAGGIDELAFESILRLARSRLEQASAAR